MPKIGKSGMENKQQPMPHSSELCSFGGAGFQEFKVNSVSKQPMLTGQYSFSFPPCIGKQCKFWARDLPEEQQDCEFKLAAKAVRNGIALLSQLAVSHEAAEIVGRLSSLLGVSGGEEEDDGEDLGAEDLEEDDEEEDDDSAADDSGEEESEDGKERVLDPVEANKDGR